MFLVSVQVKIAKNGAIHFILLARRVPLCHTFNVFFVELPFNIKVSGFPTCFKKVEH